jgi:hypothetical protein
MRTTIDEDPSPSSSSVARHAFSFFIGRWAARHRSPFALSLRTDKTVRASAACGGLPDRQEACVSDRMDFEIVCPNDHNQTVTFSQKEFEEKLKSGALVFHCNTCDTDWPPSHEEIAEIRRQLSASSPPKP